MKFKHKKKESKDVVRAMLMKETVMATDNAFTVIFGSDGSGSYVEILVEKNANGSIGWKDLHCIPSNFLGWRVIKSNVPIGYIKVFYNDDGTKKIVKEYDE